MQQPERPRRRRLLVLLGTLGTAGMGVLVGVLVNVLSTQAQRVVAQPSVSSSTAPQLEVDEVSLTSGGAQGARYDVRFTPYKIDVKMLNTGSGVAVINHAKLKIEEFATVPKCASQGSLDSTHTYTSNLPTNPKPGQLVDIPLSQKVPPNDADRFDVLLRAPLPRSDVGSVIYLYRLHFYLAYNVGVKPLDVGYILADLPYPPDAGEYYLDSYYSAHPQVAAGAVTASDLPAYRKCVVKNSRVLHSILSLPSMRPAELAKILPTLKYG
jgi:hypothetical protein